MRISDRSDSYNVGILVFLVILGAMVCLMNKAGGSAAFGRWASTHIRGSVGAQLSAVLLGILIFIDDYFNCLTVGSVMRPVTDKHNVSRAKLAYIIDATAAPVCIIAPISSWAAAVTGFVEGEDGLSTVSYTHLDVYKRQMLGLSAGMLAMFSIFSAILSGTGGAETFIKMGKRIAGRSVGGSGKIAVIASSLFGLISGSAMGNVVATGVFTIPSMKRAGYSNECCLLYTSLRGHRVRRRHL